MKILLVEDEKELRSVIVEVLQMMGHEVTPAGNGIIGIETFYDRNGDFDIVITDFQMPGADGIDVARSIREISDVPILLCSGNKDEEKERRYADSGANWFIEKLGLRDFIADMTILQKEA